MRSAGWIRRPVATLPPVLFHIEQVHTPKNCPYGNGGSRSLHDASVAGVDVKAVYGSFMEHTIYLVVEADDIEQPTSSSCRA